MIEVRPLDAAFGAEVAGWEPSGSLQPDERDRIRSALSDHSLRPERLYSHEWRPGDLVMFDTVGTMHSRDDHDHRLPRSMRQLSTLLPE